MITQPEDQAEGERLKGDALKLLEARRDLYILRGRRALLTALLAVGEATADDVRAAVDLPRGINPKCFGSVPGALAKAGIIRRAGFAKTCRPTAHARPVSVWQLADRAAAEHWLSDHPDGSDLDGAPPATDRQGFLFSPTANEPTPTVAAAGVR